MLRKFIKFILFQKNSKINQKGFNNKQKGFMTAIWAEPSEGVVSWPNKGKEHRAPCCAVLK